jgi:hypothetical protein
MRKIYSAAFLLLFAFALSACTSVNPAVNVRPDSNAQPDSGARPAWIDNPGNGVSASAATHVKGRVAQEELAIQRAREEYAKRFGVSIQSVQNYTTSVANNSASTVGSKVSHEETSQTAIKAMVKAKWRDNDSDVFWVLLVPGDQ